MTRATCVLTCIALAMFFASSLGQEDTVSYWMDRGNESCRDAFNETGNTTLKNLLLSEAMEDYDKAAEIDPRSSQAWLKKSIIFFEMSRYDDALASITRSIEIEPLNADALYMKGGFCGEMGRFEEALEAFNETLKVDPERTDAWFWKADFLATRGSYEEALKAYDRSIETDPESAKAARAWESKGHVLKAAGREEVAGIAFSMAGKLYDKAIEKTPDDANAWYGKGTILLYQGNCDGAIDALDRSLQLAPSFLNAWYFRGVALNQTGRYEEAVQSFDKVLEADPGQLRALNDKRKALQAMGCVVEVGAACWLRKGDDLRSQFLAESYMVNNISNNTPKNTSLGSFPENASAWLGKNEESVRAYQRALEAANSTLEADPGDTGAWREKGAALASLGFGEASNESYQKAVDLFNQSIDNDPRNASIWWLKAETLGLMGMGTSALEAYDYVIELNSSKAAAAWIRKSDIYFFKNDQNQSVQAFDTAVTLMDNDISGPSSLARLNASDDQFVAMWSGDHNKDFTCSTRDNHTGYSVVGWKDGNITLRISTWWYKGHILRVSFNRYNESIGSFDLYMQVDSNIIDSWRDKSLSVESRLRDHQRVIEALGRKSWGKAVSAKAEETGQI